MALTERLAIVVDASVAGAAKDFGKLGKSADDLNDKIDGQGGLSKGLDRVKAAAHTVGPALGAGLLAGIPAAAAVGAALFKTGADLEQMRDKAEIVFGSEIGLVDKWAKANANAMGLTSSEATGLAANLADLLIPMGMSREQAAKMSTDIVSLSGALSAWSGGTKSAAEVSEILTSAMLGERDSLKGLGISISEADVQQRLLQKGQQDLTGTALEQAEAMATMELIFEKSKDAQAAFGDGSKSTNERMAEATARAREMRDEIAAKLTPALVDAGDAALDFFDDVGKAIQQDREDGFLAWLDDVDAKLGDGGLKDDVGDFLRGVTDGIGDFFSGLGDILADPFRLGTLQGRASGGLVSANTPYIVGEKGPELFVPSAGGTIVPNGGTFSAAGGSGITINVNAGMGTDGAEVGRQVAQALTAYKRRGGVIAL